MNPRINLLCVQCAYPVIILFWVGMVMCAGFIPPPSPSLNAQQIAAIYSAHPGMILFSANLLMFASVFFVPFFAAISVQMARIEGSKPILAITQLALGVITAVTVLVAALLIAAAAFRPDRDAGDVLLLNDLTCLLLVWVISPALLQCLAIAACVLSDKNPLPLFPRWVGHLNLCNAVILLLGTGVLYDKAGPFAWNGIIGFWLVIVAYFIWMVVMLIYVSQAIKRPASTLLKPLFG